MLTETSTGDDRERLARSNAGRTAARARARVHRRSMTRAHLGHWPDVFTLPRTTPGIATGWHMWTGNVVRQPAFRDKPYRQPPSGLPNADRVMEWGVVLSNDHALTHDDCAYIGACVDEFMTGRGRA